MKDFGRIFNSMLCRISIIWLFVLLAGCASGEWIERGNGVFVSQDGVIATADHLVQGCKSIMVKSTKLSRVPARVIQHGDYLKGHDAALLKIGAKSPAFLVLNPVRPADDVDFGYDPRYMRILTYGAIGYQGASPTIIPSEVLGVARNAKDTAAQRAPSWLAAIRLTPGMSGSPLIGPDDRVLGLLSQTIPDHSGLPQFWVENIGVVTPSAEFIDLDAELFARSGVSLRKPEDSIVEVDCVLLNQREAARE